MPQRTMRMQTDVSVEAAKALPPVAVSTVEAVARDGTGIGPVGWATIIYIALQAAYLLWKWRRDIKRERNERHTH